MRNNRSNELSLSFKIERSNDLNALSPKGMSLTELRFLAIYQAKINARNPDTRAVTFNLKEFCDIMDIKQLTVTHIKKVADDIICKPVHLPSDMSDNGVMVVPLFNECNVYQNRQSGEWEVKIECHPKLLPYMFEMKRNYFTYELWNALKLKSVNQVRMYEILKQYEKIGERTIELEELKRLLGIESTQYETFKNFRIRVVEPCQIALEQHTDIRFTYQTVKRGRKIFALAFSITKNENFKDDLRLKEFFKPEDMFDVHDNVVVENEAQMVEVVSIEENVSSVDSIDSLYLRCEKAYTIPQLVQLRDYILNSGVRLNTDIENYIYSVYCKIKIENINVTNIFKYTFAIIEKRVNTFIFGENNCQKDTPKQESSYDLDEFRTFIHSTKRIMHD